MKMMKALQLTQTFPSLEAIQLPVTELPKPQLTPGNVIVRVHAAGLNQSDVGGVIGFFPNSKLPRIPGRDFAGVVEEGPAEWLGKRVWGSINGIYADGTNAEYITVPSNKISELPSNLSMIQGAALGVPLITAHLALFQTTPIKKGDKVLITGANGAVGLCAMQIARWKGAHPVGLVRSPESQEFLKSFGFNSQPGEAQNVVSLSDEDWKSQVKNIGPFSKVLNGIGNLHFDFFISSLADEGTYVTYSAPAGQREVTVDLFQLYRRGLKLDGVMSAGKPSYAYIFEDVKEGFESGALKGLFI